MIGRALVGCVALVLLATGCSGEDEPPATLPTLTASASPTASVPPPPPETEGEDHVAAAEFAKYYLTVVDAAYATADPDALSELSHPACEGCQVLLREVQGLAAEGNRYEGGQYVIESAIAPSSDVRDYLVNLTYTRPVGRIVRADTGEFVSEDPAVAQTEMQMRVVKASGGWLVYGLRTL